ncbi:putative transcriptional regulator yihL [Edwardsiella anguillarum ET080813]|nr:putative transcriptional regulator yihL [Edwardsiella anguillarum ET080813]
MDYIMETVSTVELAKEQLNQWIDNGMIGAGGKLPSERELSELLGIKRMTLRQALLNLEGESKIFRKDRRGWFVALPRFNYNPNEATSYKQAAIEQGRVPSWGYLEKRRVLDAPPRMQSLLQADPQQGLYRIRGWGALDGHKVFYHETYINPRVAPDFIDHLGESAFADVWNQHYQRPTVTRHLAFKPTRLNAEASRVIGGNCTTPAIQVEKFRADMLRNILQIDIEYWRFESVDFYIDL